MFFLLWFLPTSKFVSLYVGVLMWEVFTCGKMPYGRLKNAEVVERVQRGIVLERPPRCPEKIYAVIIHQTDIFMWNSHHHIHMTLYLFCVFFHIR